MPPRNSMGIDAAYQRRSSAGGRGGLLRGQRLTDYAAAVTVRTGPFFRNDAMVDPEPGKNA